MFGILDICVVFVMNYKLVYFLFLLERGEKSCCLVCCFFMVFNWFFMYEFICWSLMLIWVCFFMWLNELGGDFFFDKLFDGKNLCMSCFLWSIVFWLGEVKVGFDRYCFNLCKIVWIFFVLDLDGECLMLLKFLRVLCFNSFM